MELRNMGEFSFIDSIKNDTVNNKDNVKVGIGDDCAVYVASPEMDQLVTTDTMVDGIHFTFSHMRPFDVGFRLTTANLSDIAAMGGTPLHGLISIAAPKDTNVKDLQCIYDGIKAQFSEYNINLIGGDTVSTTGPIIITMTLIGEVPKGKAILRSGAKAGDWIGVTNYLGSAAVGLDVIGNEVKDYYVSKDAFRRPNAQIELGQFLRNRKVHAMNDISDGLASELREIAEASQVRMRIYKDAIPLHKETLTWAESSGVEPIEFALYGGEDFQLVFTVDEIGKKQLEDHPLLTFIGRVEEGEPAVILIDETNGAEEQVDAHGYDHFL